MDIKIESNNFTLFQNGYTAQATRSTNTNEIIEMMTQNTNIKDITKRYQELLLTDKKQAKNYKKIRYQMVLLKSFEHSYNRKDVNITSFGGFTVDIDIKDFIDPEASIIEQKEQMTEALILLDKLRLLFIKDNRFTLVTRSMSGGLKGIILLKTVPQRFELKAFKKSINLYIESISKQYSEILDTHIIIDTRGGAKYNYFISHTDEIYTNDHSIQVDITDTYNLYLENQKQQDQEKLKKPPTGSKTTRSKTIQVLNFEPLEPLNLDNKAKYLMTRSTILKEFFEHKIQGSNTYYKLVGIGLFFKVYNLEMDLYETHLIRNRQENYETILNYVYDLEQYEVRGGWVNRIKDQFISTESIRSIIKNSSFDHNIQDVKATRSTLFINKYIDKDSMIRTMLKGGKQFIKAPTGSGKTFSILHSLNSYCSHLDISLNQVVFIVPNISIVKQIENDENYKDIDKQCLYEGQFYDSSGGLVVSTIDSIQKTIFNNFHTVIIDEYHSLFIQDFRLNAINKLYNKIKDSDHLVNEFHITATYTVSIDLDYYDHITVYKSHQVDTRDILITLKDTDDTTYINKKIIGNLFKLLEQYPQDKFMVVIKNKVQLDNIKALLDKKNISSKVFTTDSKQDPAYLKILTTGLIKYRVILSTNIWNAGVNFNNLNTFHIIILNELYTENVIQLVGRFRKSQKINVHIYNKFKKRGAVMTFQQILDNHKKQLKILLKEQNKFNQMDLHAQIKHILDTTKNANTKEYLIHEVLNNHTDLKNIKTQHQYAIVKSVNNVGQMVSSDPDIRTISLREFKGYFDIVDYQQELRQTFTQVKIGRIGIIETDIRNNRIDKAQRILNTIDLIKDLFKQPGNLISDLKELRKTMSRFETEKDIVSRLIKLLEKNVVIRDITKIHFLAIAMTPKIYNQFQRYLELKKYNNVQSNVTDAIITDARRLFKKNTIYKNKDLNHKISNYYKIALKHNYIPSTMSYRLYKDSLLSYYTKSKVNNEYKYSIITKLILKNLVIQNIGVITR